MPEVIQDWLGTRLGVLLDLTPQNFGRNTKDGKLLAKLLYSYGVIPSHVFDKIKESRNYHDCFHNLSVLKPWLDHIEVAYEESVLQKMAEGDGLAAISIFYAIYLNLERKDRLYYLSVQKERFSEDNCRNKFKVHCVPEKEIMGDTVDTVSQLAMPLIEKRDMIDFHREKCEQVLEAIKKIKGKFKKTMTQKQPLSPIISKHSTSQPIDKKLMEVEETQEKIKSFEKIHVLDSPDLTYEELVELTNTEKAEPSFPIPSLTEAENIIGNIKKRKKSEVYAQNFALKMQHKVLDEYWNQIIEKQEKDLDKIVYSKLLKQSQYEKQMTSKLYMLRNHKKNLIENRNKIENLKIEQQEKEYDDSVTKKTEMKGEYWEKEEFEKERIAELHRRLYDEKVRIRKQMIGNESRKICEALVDIAIRISEIRDLTGCQIPKSFIKDMKELFFKDLSIFDLLDNLGRLYEKESSSLLFEEESDEEEVISKDEEYEQMKREEKERQEILDECDFNDYINLLGPWMIELLFPNGSDTEPKHIILGHIVHKLLAIKYPAPNTPPLIVIKPMKPTAIVLNLTEDISYKMLSDLLEACKILVVRVDDAINFVLGAYKQELSIVRDIDINFQKATTNALKNKIPNGKKKNSKKKIQLLKKEDSEKTATFEEEFYVLDKQTQTPRVIPEDDLDLSPNAEVGKMAFEALGSGDPVPDPVIVSAIVGYVASKQDDYKGWVLLNYPLFYSQASDLEFALTGYRTLPVVKEIETLEELEGFTYRKEGANSFESDIFAENRLSRLVPKPDDNKQKPLTEKHPKTYFDSFILMKKYSASSRRNFLDPSDVTPMEKFYFDEEILLNFEYTSLNFQVIKNLGKVILGEALQPDENNLDLVPKTSLEIFGSVVLELNEKWDSIKKKSGKDSTTKKITKESYNVELLEKPVKNDEVEEEKFSEELISLAKPGDPNWEWANGTQPEQMQIALASIWENMETAFIEDFKNIFFCLRVHRGNVLTYSSFIRKSIRKLIKTPDDKQKVLSDFQQMFNDIDEDLRPDVDIKCELHVRVSELEEILMEMADKRKTNSQKDLGKIAQDGWVADEMASLVNVYLTAVQLEADRCIDSCQVIMDYYISLQQKVPDEKFLKKILVSKLQISNRKYSIISSPSNKTSLLSPKNSDIRKSNKSVIEQSSRSNHDKTTKTRSWTERRKRSSETSFLNGAAEVINDILVNLSLPDDRLTPFHNFFTDTTHLVINEIKNVLESCISESKKNDKTAPKNSKKISDAKLTINKNLTTEWTTVLENELTRFVFRVKLILARGIFEMNEFLTTILNVLSSLTEETSEMYMKEIQSISECCKVFRCGIEEEIKIKPRLELKEDEFIVDEDVLLFSSSDDRMVNEALNDEEKKYRFSIEQLSLLCQKLQRVAPDGEIIKKSLIYIFEDLRILKREIENSNCFPEIWDFIEPNDLIYILNEVYQSLEIVHWKDFIIYAMDLPVPSESEILLMRKTFRKYDPLVTELIIRENYDKVPFWFETSLDHFMEEDRNEKAKDLLYRMYQVNEQQTNYSALLLAFCKDENPILGFIKALALAIGKKIKFQRFSDNFSSIEGEDNFDYEEFSGNKRRKPDYFPWSSTEISRKCTPKEKIVRCDDHNSRKSSTIEEELKESLNLLEKDGEDGSVFYYSSELSHTISEASAVPCKILTSLLKASYPKLPQLNVFLDCKQTFQDTLNSIYDSFESNDDSIEVNKLIHHKFLYRLLQNTNKFKFIKIQKIIQSVIESKLSMVQSTCSPNNLNVNFCLN